MTTLANDIFERASTALSPDCNYTVEEVAAVALELSAMATEIGEHLEPLKVRLREYAREELVSKTGKVAIRGICPLSGDVLGEVQVTFPDDRLTLAKDVDQLREDLGETDFSVYIDSRTTFAPTRNLKAFMEERIRHASDDPVANRVMASLVVTEATPRVGFRPLPDILIGEPDGDADGEDPREGQ